MAWYTNYKLVEDGDGYTLEIYLNNNLAEFADEIFAQSNGEESPKLDDKIKDLVKDKFSDIRINAIKLLVGTIVVATMPFFASTVTSAVSEPASISQSATTSVTGTVTTSKLNVRTGPSTSYSIMHSLWNGNQVKIIGNSGNWYNIRLSDGRTGWVSKDFMSTQGERTGTVTTSKLNVRTGPSTSNPIIHALWSGNQVKIIGESGNWYNIRLSDGRTGWVSKDFMSIQGERTGRVTTSKLNVRTGPSTSHPIIHALWSGNQVRIIGESGNWYNIRLSDGRTGWVSKDFINTNQVTPPPQTDTKQQKINTVIATAKSLLGTPYVFAGASPQDGGFDCSGLTLYSFKQVGVSLNRISSDQARQGIAVSRGNIKAGDLVFFSINQNGRVDHVGIYIGNGQMIHSPKPGDVVKTVNMNVNYWNQRFVTARRMIY